MGYFFRVQVCYLREIYLQRLVQTSEGDWKEQETAAASQLELDIEILPRLTTAIARFIIDTIFTFFWGGVRGRGLGHFIVLHLNTISFIMGSQFSE